MAGEDGLRKPFWGARPAMKTRFTEKRDAGSDEKALPDLFSTRFPRLTSLIKLAPTFNINGLTIVLTFSRNTEFAALVPGIRRYRLAASRGIRHVVNVYRVIGFRV